MNKPRKNWPSYLVLVVVLAVGVSLFLFSPPLANQRKLLIFFLATAYFLWGIIYHHRRQNLAVKVALEYLIIAILGVVFLFSLVGNK